MRSPTMRRIADGWTDSFIRGGPAGEAAGAPPARNASSAATLPSGPLPFNDARSIFFSLAILLAAGDAAMRPLGANLAGASRAGALVALFATAEVAAGFVARSLVTVSPGATIMAIFFPTAI